MTQLEELVQFIKELQGAEPENTAVFHTLLAQSEALLVFSDADFARELRVSRPTVNRWRTAKNAPAVYVRKHVYDMLLIRARGQFKRLEKASSGQGSPGSGSGGKNSRPPMAASSRLY